MWFTELFCYPIAPDASSRRMHKKLAQWENHEAYQDTFIHLVNMWLTLFKWDGLPDTCDERALEYTLMFSGKALFFRDDEPLTIGEYPVIGSGQAHYFHTPVVLGEGLNIYYEHTNRRAYSYKYNKNFTVDNSVLIRNNRLMNPTLPFLMVLTRRLANAMRTIESLANHYKLPYVFRMDESEIKSWEEFERQRNNNETSVFASKSLNPDSITVMPTGITPGMLKELWDHYRNVENNGYTRLGLNNANTEKRERLIESEVESNNELIQASIEPYLLAREEACELINKMFGLNLSVSLRNGGGTGGDLYNDPMGLPESGEPAV